MASNFKSKSSSKESPNEPFKRALTGLAPPAAAKKLVDLWRPLIEDRAGKKLDQLENLVEDQRHFGDAVHDLLDALEMGEDRNSDSEDEDEDGEEDNRKQESGEDGEAADSDDMQRTSMEDSEASAEDLSLIHISEPTRQAEISYAVFCL